MPIASLLLLGGSFALIAAIVGGFAYAVFADIAAAAGVGLVVGILLLRIGLTARRPSAAAPPPAAAPAPAPVRRLPTSEQVRTLLAVAREVGVVLDEYREYRDRRRMSPPRPKRISRERPANSLRYGRPRGE